MQQNNQIIEIGYEIVNFFEKNIRGNFDEILNYLKLNNIKFLMMSDESIQKYAITYLNILISSNLIKYNNENFIYERIF